MREVLRPIYGQHTDIAISMVGPKAKPEVWEAAKAGNLHKAHCEQANIKYDNSSKKYKQVPSWFAKPIGGIPRRKPPVELMRFGTKINNVKIFSEGKKIGVAGILIEEDADGKVLVVSHLQQETANMSTRAARRFEGWKNSAMKEIEKLASTAGCNRIYYSSGESHSILNCSSKPIHGEVLETYGRLPIQNGYALEVTRGRHVLPWTGYLCWVKELKKTEQIR